MWKYMLKRIVVMIPQVILLSMIVFFLANHVQRSPISGSPYAFINNAGLARISSWEELWQFIITPVQDYSNWFRYFLRGDWGHSFVHQRSVLDVLHRPFLNTLKLSMVALVMMYAMAIPMALISGRYAGSWKDKLLTAVSYVGFAVPTFIFTLLCLYLFAFRLGWFPSGGTLPLGVSPQTAGYWLARIHRLILPAFCIAAVTMMPTYLYLKTEILQYANHPMTTAARSKGCSERRIYHKHIFRNSMLPGISIFVFQLAALLGGTVFAEMIFSIPGMGLLFLTSLEVVDQSMIAAMVMLYSGTTIFGSCLSDFLIAMVDPRIRLN